ncbi:MAG TPA: response regulator transcription factor [Caldilineaceae bacterium]|nr:response regulator transcription factor [Caldilineaceae bacterium]
MIRVFIVHPTETVSSFMAQSLAEQSDMRVIYQVTSVNEALVRMGKDNCQVVLASATLPNDGAMTLIRKVRSSRSNVRVVVTGVTNDKEDIMRYVLAGALGYTLAEEGITQLVDTVRAAFENKAMISPEIAARLMSHVAKLSTIATRTTPDTSAHAELTERENDVLALMAEGCSNKIIADRLIIGIGTVKNHVHNVLKKLNLRSRKEAATYLMHIRGGDSFARTRYSGPVM